MGMRYSVYNKCMDCILLAVNGPVPRIGESLFVYKTSSGDNWDCYVKVIDVIYKMKYIDCPEIMVIIEKES